jgi:RNA polymerase sigma factor (sigma-70 family)
LSQFADQRDGAAFEALLRRHGPLVLNICRKLLCDRHEVEDAFQATFLVLVRKAGSLPFEGSLAPWISTVAYRIAARARERRIRQNAREQKIGEPPEVPAKPDADHDETSRVLHEELGRLPERLRAAIVCCYLDGMTHEVAAAQLGCPVGTVRSRLARARGRLQIRLARRGVTLADGTLGMLLLRSSRPQIPARLLRSTISLTLDSAVQTVGAGVASAPVLSLVEGVLNHMILRKMAMIGVTLLPLGAIVLAGVALAFPQGSEGAKPAAPRGEPHARQARQEPFTPPVETVKTYYVGDLIGAETDEQPSRDASRSKMAPLLKLIESTIAPGTWRVFDEGGNEIRIEGVSGQIARKGQTDPERRTGTMAPFVADHLSVSLIVQHTPEVHEQVAKLFKCLRDYKFLTVRTPETRLVPPAPNAPGAPAAEHPADARGERKKRLKQLLEQIQHEIDAMEQEIDSPARPGFTGR